MNDRLDSSYENWDSDNYELILREYIFVSSAAKPIRTPKEMLQNWNGFAWNNLAILPAHWSES